MGAVGSQQAGASATLGRSLSDASSSSTENQGLGGLVRQPGESGVPLRSDSGSYDPLGAPASHRQFSVGSIDLDAGAPLHSGGLDGAEPRGGASHGSTDNQGALLRRSSSDEAPGTAA